MALHLLCAALLVIVSCVNVHGYSDIESLLRDNAQVSQPVPPPGLNSALKQLVGDLDSFSSLPNNLQRAMLWSSGWVRAIPEGASSSSGSDASDQYVQVYVQCGTTMGNIFIPYTTFENQSSCPIKDCYRGIIAHAMTTCEPSFVESKSLCALSPDADSFDDALESKLGPMWSMIGSYVEPFDPQLFRFDNDGDDNTTVYMLAQSGSWSMDDDTCPIGPKFIVPCRKVSADEIQGTWCKPAIEPWVYEWVKNETNSSGSSTEFNSDTSVTVPAIFGIIVACGVVILIVGWVFIRRRRFTGTNYNPGGLWDDEVIISNRIPREKVKTLKLISRGAFGEVYTGLYNDDQVAVKMLLPNTRRDMKMVNEFLAEAKLTATMDHPRIVSFIGVAWDSFSDLCVVLEFMDGGDLRSLLNTYERSGHTVGFDREKVTIALHVAHALTYLHSLEPSVIHRDLKSRNILLNEMHEAKVTDFGISRERLDRTMTAGVGTSLWMAPEVMTGEKYDDKADIFSFGVVLSELDLHTLPYTAARFEMQQSQGRQMTDATLLQGVAMGTICVNFSDTGVQSVKDLGNACVSVDPANRPSAAEALFKLQTILSKEL
ncbi:hypothetical protein DVH05_003506 [Phytophthora capsici]|nr:hypothetical protein DVH05_003506 [Phytophthora capsici]